MNRTVKRSLAATLGVSLLLLVGCGSDSKSESSDTTKAKDTTTTTAAPELMLEDVWARQSPMGATMGAAYLNITSPVDDKLLKASVDPSVAKEAQIHETVMAEEGSDMSSTTAMGDETTTTAMGSSDMSTTTAAMGGDKTSTTMGSSDNMTMREVDSIELPAGKMVELKPGGYHIMLIDLVKPLKVGDKIEITLEFEKAGTKTVTAEVKEG